MFCVPEKVYKIFNFNIYFGIRSFKIERKRHLSDFPAWYFSPTHTCLASGRPFTTATAILTMLKVQMQFICYKRLVHMQQLQQVQWLDGNPCQELRLEELGNNCPQVKIIFHLFSFPFYEAFWILHSFCYTDVSPTPIAPSSYSLPFPLAQFMPVSF